MTFGVTPEGFRAKRFDDIITELGEALKTQLGIDIDADPDSIAKVLTNIYALPLAEEWALTQSLQSMFDIDKAEGKHLDDLVGYVGLRRLQATKSTGIQYITATQSTSIPPESEFEDSFGNIFINPDTINVSPSNCVFVEYTYPYSLPIGTVLSVTINGITSSTTVNSGDTPTAPSNRLVNAINAASNGVSATVVLGGFVDILWELSITNDNDTQASIIVGGAVMTTKEVISVGAAEYSEVGEYNVSANTVVNPPSITGVTGTTNRYAYTVGRLEETDAELRARHTTALGSAGAATVPAIEADLLTVDGVTTVIVIENDTSGTVSSVPPKSFLSIIKGGDPQEIGERLWLTKPAGIKAYGDIDVTVVDSQGQPQVVSYSQPRVVNVHVKITYTLYSEEAGEFPTDGEAQIAAQVLSYGDGLDIGEDVLPQRFASEIFQNIGGLQSVVVEVQETFAPSDPPVTLDWQVTPLPIDAISEADFKDYRITVSQGV